MSTVPCNPEMTGTCLRNLRCTRRWTQAELARRSGLSVSTVSALERGMRDMSVETLFALCRALCCTPAALLGGQ